MTEPPAKRLRSAVDEDEDLSLLVPDCALSGAEGLFCFLIVFI